MAGSAAEVLRKVLTGEGVASYASTIALQGKGLRISTLIIRQNTHGKLYHPERGWQD